MRGCLLFLLIFFLVAVSSVILLSVFGVRLISRPSYTVIEIPSRQAEADPYSPRPTAPIHHVQSTQLRANVAWGSLAALLTIPLLLGILLLLLLFRGSSRAGRVKHSRAEGMDQDRLIQEMFHGFDRLDERIEILETLLMDEFKKR